MIKINDNVSSFRHTISSINEIVRNNLLAQQGGNKQHILMTGIFSFSYNVFCPVNYNSYDLDNI